MNYVKIYNDLIARAQTRKLIGYKERHHIVPKCMHGSNNKENLVDLTAQEHFIAHKLLCEIYPHDIKLKYALWAMVNGISNREIKISAREYHRIKQLHKNCVRDTHLGKIVTVETRMKQSSVRLNSLRIKCTYCDVVSDIGNIQRWHNDNCIHNPHLSDNTINRSHQCIYCGICTTKTNIMRWHNDNCKLKTN
jgi:hypothetical protein